MLSNPIFFQPIDLGTNPSQLTLVDAAATNNSKPRATFPPSRSAYRNVLDELRGHLNQSVCGPRLEPVDRGAVHQPGVHPGAVTEALPDRRHREHDVQVVPHPVGQYRASGRPRRRRSEGPDGKERVRVICHPRAVGFKGHFLWAVGPFRDFFRTPVARSLIADGRGEAKDQRVSGVG